MTFFPDCIVHSFIRFNIILICLLLEKLCTQVPTVESVYSTLYLLCNPSHMKIDNFAIMTITAKILSMYRRPFRTSDGIRMYSILRAAVDNKH